MSIESVVEAPDVEPPFYPPRRLVLIAAGCVAATLTTLFTAGLIQLRISVNGSEPDTGYAALLGYPTAATVIVSLFLLRLFPRRGWAAMLAAGALLTLPLPLSIVDNDMFEGAPENLMTVLVVIGFGLVLLGGLGAAAWLSSAGAAGAAGTVAGVAIVMPIVGILAFVSLLGSSLIDARWLLVTFAVLGILGAAGALITSLIAAQWRFPMGAPSARVIAAGVVGAILPMLFVWFSPKDIAELFGDDVGVRSRLFLLVLGLAMVVPGLLAALLGGWRMLAASLICGLIPAMLLASAVYALVVWLDSGLVLPALFGGLALGWLAAISRRRAWFGAAALAVGALMLIAGPSDGSARRASAGATTLALLLIVVGVAGAIAAIAAVVTILTTSERLPATLGALAPAMQTGGGAVLTYLIAAQSDGSARPGVSTASAIIGVALLLLAAGLVAISLWHQRSQPVESPAEDTDAVWYQLPPDDDPQ